MANAERTLGAVTLPASPNAREAVFTALCPLCRGPLTDGVTVWCHIVGDGDGVRRSVHASCAHSYGTYLRAMGFRS
jgi:hypothetical protein